MRPILFFLLLCVVLISCSKLSTPFARPELLTNSPTNLPGSTRQEQSLTVFAAASLTEAFSEIGAKFQAINPSIEIRFNFAGSQTLQAQIESGAPADVFASANQANMDALTGSGFVDQNTPRVFVTNSLIIILPESNPAHAVSLHDLARPGLKLVLADETVPAGRYARQILEMANSDPIYGEDFAALALANIVSNEMDVKQVLAKVQLGEADAGIVYVSDSVAAPDLITIPIPADMNVSAKYSIACLRGSINAELANKFIQYVLSDEGQVILQRWGFSAVQ
jgi:molybdate transport system substrate-binding protein